MGPLPNQWIGKWTFQPAITLGTQHPRTKSARWRKLNKCRRKMRCIFYGIDYDSWKPRAETVATVERQSPAVRVNKPVQREPTTQIATFHKHL